MSIIVLSSPATLTEAEEKENGTIPFYRRFLRFVPEWVRTHAGRCRMLSLLELAFRLHPFECGHRAKTAMNFPGRRWRIEASTEGSGFPLQPAWPGHHFPC